MTKWNLENFTLKEMVQSPTAKRWGWDEQFEPTDETRENLYRTAANVLQPARDFMGVPVRVTSGYRCGRLNTAVGGARHSDHLFGRAADITCRSRDLNRSLFHYIKDNLAFKQLIWYFDGWSYPYFIHVSYRAGANRGEVLICHEDKNGKREYRPWKK